MKKSTIRTTAIFIFLILIPILYMKYANASNYSNGDFNATFKLVKNGISKKVYEIEIQNTKDYDKYLNLGFIFQQTNFNIDKVKNVKLYELVQTTKEVPNFVYVNKTVIHFIEDKNLNSKGSLSSINENNISTDENKTNKTSFACDITIPKSCIQINNSAYRCIE